ncbi:hypothetical protein [Tenacibaculum amylolyticum]|uniref:hypothetical protein n=1 Tax=Tenacibaculum amylolyticum TaxID=104269 RepID=UPI0038940C46
MKYLIETKRDGGNHVQVLKKHKENHYTLAWTFALKGDSAPIVLAEMYNDDCFVIGNWNGWIRIYSISKKELIFEKNYEGKINTRAQISEDKTKLYVSVGRTMTMEIISLIDFSILKTIELSEYVESQFFTLINEEKIIYYEPDSYDDTHGFYVLNPVSEELKFFPVKYPQWDDLEPFNPVINVQQNVGVMPLTDDIEIKKNEEGVSVFVLKIMVFDLDTFEITNIIPIRELSVEHLGYKENDNEKIAEELKTKEDEEEYQEAVAKLINDHIYSIVFDDNGSLWISFRGGIVRNVTLEGTLSPLLATESLNDNDSGVFKHPYFHSRIYKVKEDTIILREHSETYKMPYSKEELKSTQKVIAKKVMSTKPYEIIISTEEEQVIEEHKMVVVDVSDVDLELSYIAALDEIIKLTTAIDDIRSGHVLQFRVKNSNGVEDDEVFFNKAIQVKGGEERIVKIIENFVAYKDSARLYSDYEVTALAHAMYALADTSEKHIDLAIQYLGAIDFDHDVFNRESLLQLLKEKYHKEYGDQIVEKLSQLEFGESWVEDYTENCLV